MPFLLAPLAQALPVARAASRSRPVLGQGNQRTLPPALHILASVPNKHCPTRPAESTACFAAKELDEQEVQDKIEDLDYRIEQMQRQAEYLLKVSIPLHKVMRDKLIAANREMTAEEHTEYAQKKHLVTLLWVPDNNGPDRHSLATVDQLQKLGSIKALKQYLNQAFGLSKGCIGTVWRLSQEPENIPPFVADKSLSDEGYKSFIAGAATLISVHPSVELKFSEPEKPVSAPGRQQRASSKSQS